MIQAYCPHHGLYSIGLEEARNYLNELGPRSCAHFNWVQNEKKECNEEVAIFINGKKMAHPEEIIKYFGRDKFISKS